MKNDINVSFYYKVVVIKVVMLIVLSINRLIGWIECWVVDVFVILIGFEDRSNLVEKEEDFLVRRWCSKLIDMCKKRIVM